MQGTSLGRKGSTMSRRLIAAVLFASTLGASCATGSNNGWSAVGQLVLQDAVQIGVAALATRLGVNNQTVSTGLTTAQNIYASSNKSAAAKSAAAKAGTDKIASLTSLTVEQRQLAQVGLSDLLR